MPDQALKRQANVPDFDQFDDAGIRAFIKTIPEGETWSLTINHVDLTATRESFAQDLIADYRDHREEKQQSGSHP